VAPVNHRVPDEVHTPRHAAGKAGRPAAASRFPVAAGIAAVSLMFVCAVALFVILIRFGGIPTPWLIVFGAVLGILTVLFAAACDTKKTAVRITGFVLSVLFSVILLVGTIFVGKAISTLNHIYDDSTSVTYQISVIVPADDPAQSVQDAAGYTYGVLESIDRANTDKAMALVYDDLGATFQVSEYPNMSGLIAALYDGEAGAILLNEGYRSLVTESFSDFENRTRVLHTYSLLEDSKKPVEDSKPEPNASVSAPPAADEDKRDAFIVYLTGIDTYGSEETVSRSDVNIMAAVNPNTKEVLLVTTPRDAYVELPTAYYNMDKLTHAPLYGGVESSMETLENLYELEIDYFVRVNFTGFETIVDSIGGIEVYSEVAFSEKDCYYDEGWNYLDGYEALNFVRSRKQFVDGDFQRGRNQMAAIEGILDKVMSPAILTSYLSLMDSIAGTFSTNFTDTEIADLVRMQLDDGAEWHISSYEVAGWPDSAICYSMGDEVSIVFLDSDSVDESRNMIQAVLDGKKLP